MWADRYPLAFRTHPYRPGPDPEPRHQVVIVGAGPVGLMLALDLGLQGVPVTVLDDHEGIAAGSRAICFAKRTLEIADRLGFGERLLAEGVQWNTGRVYRGETEVYAFDLLPEKGHRFPAFINLPQPDFEKALADRIADVRAAGAPIDVRGRHRVVGVAPGADVAVLTVETPDGLRRIEADWVIAADGAGSPVRKALGLGFRGQVFRDSFLIADVRLDTDLPAERRFWFQPLSGAGASALMHRQPGGIWRLDFQIGWNADRGAELAPERVRERVARMLGPEVAFEVIWSSIYTFQCRRMDRFRHGRVIFAGDAAHQVSPFGARGANGGVQDADNLGWKLAAVLTGQAPEALLDSYESERMAAADENIRASTRSTEFISPKSPASRLFRDAVLDLAARHAVARPFVNSGRLSVPYCYDGSPLTGPDALPGGPVRTRPGAAAADAPVAGGTLLRHLGRGFTLLCIDTAPGAVPAGVDMVTLSARDAPQLAERWLGAASSAVYLLRPDHHVAARWAGFDAGAVAAALAQAWGRT